MKVITKEIKAKGQVVATIEINCPESLKEAGQVLGDAKALDCLIYGLIVKEANAARSQATGGVSLPRQIAMKLKDNPESLAKIAKMLGIDME